MAELRHHVREELAEPDGVVVIDPSAFPKKGTESCGVARQWCGRLGKVDNCQVGVFLAYAARPVTPRWTAGSTCPRTGPPTRPGARNATSRPEVKFQEKWRIALDLLDRSLPGLPHGWIVGDDEFGRAAEFRAALRAAPGALRPGRAVQHHGARPGAAPPAASPGRASAASARCRSSGPTPGRRASRSRGGSGSTVRARREGPAGGRCDDGAGPGQAGRSDRSGRAAGRDPSGGRVADRLRPDQRRAPRSRWPRWSVPSGSGTASRRCSRPATARPGSITTRCGAGSAGITT